MARIRKVVLQFSVIAAATVGAAGYAPFAGDEPCGKWSVLSTPTPENTTSAFLRDINVIADDHAWAVGHYNVLQGGNQLNFTLTLQWNGQQWNIVPSPSPTECDLCTETLLWAVDSTDSDDVWAAGGQRIAGVDGFLGGHTLVLHWDGNDWSVMDTPLPDAGVSGDYIFSVEAIASDDVWFVGGWVEVIPPGLGRKPALAMHWDGSSFTVVETPLVNPEHPNEGDGLEDIDAIASDDIWAVGGGSDGDYEEFSYIVHWNGKQWTHVPGPTPGFTSRLFAVEAIASDDVWAVGQYLDGDGNHGFAIHWDGTEWTLDPTFLGGTLALEALGPDDVYAAGGGIFRYDGIGWTQIENFSDVALPSMAGIDAAETCTSLMTAGRQKPGENFMPLAAEVVTATTPGDIDGNGTVNTEDLLQLLAAWGPCDDCPEDIDGDGTVGTSDLLMLLANWG